MKPITTTEALAAFCKTCAAHPYVTIDTEFLREKTFFSKLCLIQMAYPGKGKETAVLIDVLADGFSLDPLYELFQNEDVVKVFHAARQDLEIFYTDRQILPKPFFDTQVAAMVCGHGEQVGYEKLVRKLAAETLDKSSRFTDWSQRPLSKKQAAYALADVTHLRIIYEKLKKQIDQSGRHSWMEEETAILLDPATYILEPIDAWKRVKTRTHSRKILGVVRELAAYREELARSRNIPRNRVFKDDALMELAAARPETHKDLSKMRLLQREGRRSPVADEILAAIKRAAALKPEDLPTPEPQRERPQGSEGLAELLRVMLKAKAEEYGVAQKLIATSAQIDEIASGQDSAVFSGWRNEVFGLDAKRLLAGEVALSADGKKVRLVELK